jgi:hypothetical protein
LFELLKEKLQATSCKLQARFNDRESLRLESLRARRTSWFHQLRVEKAKGKSLVLEASEKRDL